MADNLVSYNRFTALPPVISEYGWTKEEAISTRGNPDANPAISPMASPAVSEVQLSLAPGGSDKTRLNLPSGPDVNPYEGATPSLVHSRNVVSKLGGSMIGQLENTIQSDAVPENVKGLMQDSIRRVVGMREYLGHLNEMTESVYANAIATSKG